MADMTQDQQSAYDLLRDMFEQAGLPTNSDVLDVIKNSAINGDSPEATQIALQATDTWKQRFAGNEQRRAAGLNMLSVAEYLQMEKQYADIMTQAGVPTGFYDDPSDFASFIGRSISPAEIQERVNLASDVVNREDPAVMQALEARGLTKGQVIAHALDPERAAPLIKRDLNSTLIGAAAIRAGIQMGVDYADSLASRGIQEAQAVQQIGQAADIAEPTTKLGQVYGVDYGTKDALDEVFDGNQQSSAKRKRLAGQERANFNGQSTYGVNKSSNAGQF